MTLAVVLTGGLVALVALTLLRRRRSIADPGKRITPQVEARDGSSHHQVISLAIKKKWDIELAYVDEDGVRTNRRVTPQRTGKQADDGHVRFRSVLFTGYCHLRQDVRHFRYDRIESIAVLSTDGQQRRSR